MSDNNTVNLDVNILADKALMAFTDKLPNIVGKFSSDVSPKSSEVGDVVKVALYGTKTAQHFAGNYTNNSQSTVDERTVTLDQWVFANCHISDHDKTNGVKLENLAKQVGAALARAVTTGFYNVFQTGNYGLPVLTVTPQNFTHSGLLHLRGSTIKWDEKNVIMDPESMTSIYRTTTSLSADIANSAVAGKLTSMYGMGIDECTTPIGPTGQKIHAVVAHPAAACFASRALVPAVENGGNIQWTVKEEPQTKIPVTFRMFAKPEEGRTYFVAECLYGKAVGLTDAAALVTKP